MSRGCGLTHFAAKMFLHMLAVSSVRESVCAQPRVKTLPSTVSNRPPTVCFCPLGCRERNEERCNRGVEGKWIRWQEKPHQSRLPAPQPTVAPHSARRIEPPTCHPSFKTSVTAFAAQPWLSHVQSLGITSQDCPHFTPYNHHLATDTVPAGEPSSDPSPTQLTAASENVSDVAPSDKPIMAPDYLPPARPYGYGRTDGPIYIPSLRESWEVVKARRGQKSREGYESVVTD